MSTILELTNHTAWENYALKTQGGSLLELEE